VPYVERAERLTARGWLGFLALVGLIVPVPPAFMLLLSGVVHDFGEFLVNNWLAVVLSVSVGLFWAGVATGIKVHKNRNVDREGISLIVDEAGVYLGRSRPRRVSWTDVAEVALITYHVPWVRATSTPQPIRYYIAFRRSGAKVKKNPMRWRPRKRCQSRDEISAAIQRYARTIPVVTTTI
jgi:hypothetical protein